MLRVFVYGTLKPGGRYHRAYCGKDLLEAIPGQVKGVLYHLPGLNYPGMAVGERWSQGYLLTFSDDAKDRVLAQLDQLEDYQPDRSSDENEYQRQRTEVFDREFRSLGEAWVYWMRAEKIQQYEGIYVESGSWEEES